MKVTCEAEKKENNAENVMHERLPKVFAFDIEKLRNEQREIDAEFKSVVPVDVVRDRVVRVAAPELTRVPRPRFLVSIKIKNINIQFEHEIKNLSAYGIDRVKAVDPDQKIEDETPTTFGKFFHFSRTVT